MTLNMYRSVISTSQCLARNASVIQLKAKEHFACVYAQLLLTASGCTPDACTEDADLQVMSYFVCL